MSDFTEHLREIPLFKNLDDAQFEALALSMEEVEGKMGQLLFRKGDPSDCFYVIASGGVVVNIEHEGGTDQKELGPGDFVGEIGMLRGSKRTADAVVGAKGTLIKVDKLGFDTLMSEDPYFADLVMEVTRARLQELQDSNVALDFGREGPDDSGRLLVFFSPRGGVGTTFLTCNFAKKIHDLSKKKVVVLDADLEFGACHVLLDQKNTNNLADGLIATEAEVVDPMDVQEALIKVPGGYDLFPCPSKTEDALRFTPDHLRSIVAELQRSHDYVIVDTSSSLGDATLTMFELADDVFCVLDNDIVSISRTMRTMDLLGRAGFPTDRFRMVLNKVSGYGYTHEEIERDMRREIVFRVEIDVKPVWESLNAGKLLVDTRKRARAAIDIMNGAREYLLPLGDVAGGAADADAKRERGFSLFGLFGK